MEAGWSAPLAAAPTKLLRDGQPWTEFAYDATSKAITVKSGGDPRLHVFETVVRKNGIDLAAAKGAKVEAAGVEIINATGETTAGASR